MKILCFDTETTDLIQSLARDLKYQPHVWEFCGIQFDEEGNELKRFTAQCKPGGPMSAGAARTARLTYEQMCAFSPFSHIADEVREMIEGSDLCVAHNLSFDKNMLNFEFTRLNQVLAWPKTLCTIEATTWIKGRRFNLTNLHTYLFDEAFENAHSAEADVLALARCYFELKKRELI